MGMRCLRTDLSPLVPWRWLEATTWPNLNEGCCICGSGFNAFHQPKFATTVLTGHYLLSTIFDINEDAIYWLRWRKEDSIKTGQASVANSTPLHAACCWGTVHVQRYSPSTISGAEASTDVQHCRSVGITGSCMEPQPD